MVVRLFDDTYEVFWKNPLYCRFIDLRWQMEVLSSAVPPHFKENALTEMQYSNF